MIHWCPTVPVSFDDGALSLPVTMRHKLQVSKAMTRDYCLNTSSGYNF